MAPKYTEPGKVWSKMIFKCKNCEGNVVYSPEAKKMVCPYCESEGSEERRDYTESNIKICPNCSGEVPVLEHTSALQCPYCDNYLILNSRVENEYAPRWVIPFQMGKENCKKSIREHFKKCLFAPTDFLSEAKLNEIQGIYVPFWFYDYDTTCTYEGEGKKVRTWTTGNTQYIETSYYAIAREMDISFSKMPVDASLDMPDEVMDLLEPFRYDQLQEFRPEYLSGFYGEKYNMGADTLETRIKQKMNQDVEDMMKETYTDYSGVRKINSNTYINNSEVNYGLLPVWKYLYKYQGKEYPFYVNGQTGKIVGTPPVSVKKVWAYAVSLGLSLAAVLALMNGILCVL